MNGFTVQMSVPSVPPFPHPVSVTHITGTTYLIRKEFTPKQIMSITRHKSLNSLSIYQKVSTYEKLSMAYAMSCYLQSDKDTPLRIAHLQAEIQCIQPGPRERNMNQIAVPMTRQEPTWKSVVTPVATFSKEQCETAIVAYQSENSFDDGDEIPDFDLGQIMDTIEKENMILMTQRVSDDGPGTINIIQQHQYIQHRKVRKSQFSVIVKLDPST